MCFRDCSLKPNSKCNPVVQSDVNVFKMVYYLFNYLNTRDVYFVFINQCILSRTDGSCDCFVYLSFLSFTLLSFFSIDAIWDFLRFFFTFCILFNNTKPKSLHSTSLKFISHCFLKALLICYSRHENTFCTLLPLLVFFFVHNIFSLSSSQPLGRCEFFFRSPILVPLQYPPGRLDQRRHRSQFHTVAQKRMQ